ncbi:hypothetical protein [Limoniibacter endophyticus]|nr:hypothetical protein [Limoniibacter endophyticus]
MTAQPKPARQKPSLVDQYRKIGPAAVAAALSCKAKPQTALK